MGQTIAEQLDKRGQEFVIIDNDHVLLNEVCTENEWAYVVGDATDDDVLLEAGIQRARGLASVLPTDSDNVYVVLSARMLMSNLQIIARASDDKAVLKMERAGATRVVSPYLIGGKRMGQILKRPTVADFIDITTMGNQLGLVMEEAKVREGSGLNGKNLVDSSLRRDFGVIIVAIKRPTGEMIYNPQPTETLGSGDVIVVIGKHEDLIRMKQVL